MKHTFTCFLLFLYVICYSQSSDLYHKVFTTYEGFEIDNMQSMAFDDQGFLWLGGSNFDNREIISGNNKWPLQVFNGFSFYTIPLPEVVDNLRGIEQIYKRDDGNLILIAAYDDGQEVFLLDPITHEFQQSKFKDDEKTKILSRVFNRENKNYILSQYNRLITLNELNDDLSLTPIFSFTSNENKFLIEYSTEFMAFDDFCIISDDNFQTLYFDWNGTLLKEEKSDEKQHIDETFTFNGKHYIFKNTSPQIFELDTSTKSFIPFKNKGQLNSIHLKTYNDSAANNVLINFIDEKIHINHFRKNGVENSFEFPLKKCDGMRVVSENLENDLWLATNAELHYFKFPARKVKSYLKNHSLRFMKRMDDDNIIITTQSRGWFNFNIKNDSIWPLSVKVNGNDGTFVSSRNIIEDGNNLWSTSNANITLTNKQNYKSILSKHYPIVCLEEINDSTLIYGTNGYHLMAFNKRTKEHSSLLRTDTLHIFDLAIKDVNTIICATDKGLLTYDFENKSHKFYDKSKLEDNYLLMADYDKDNGFLLGSRNGLIYKFDEVSKSISTIYKDQFNAGIATIIPNGKNKLWINTFNGFVDYNTESEITNRYSDKDGFSHNESNRYSALVIDNKFYVGTIDGLNVFNPKDLETKDDKANLTIIKANIFNNETGQFEDNYNQTSFTEGNIIILPAENRALQIDFGLENNFARDNDYSFQYKLDNKNWVNLKQQNFIAFPNLASGNYVLELKALDFSGNKIGDSLFIKIKSEEFFYKTWWFIVLVAALIIGILLYFLRQFQLRKRLQDQFALDLIQSQEDERKRIASELHDSVSQQLTLIKRKAQRDNHSEISKLTNNTLEEVRHISRGLFPPLLKQLGLTESIEQLALDVDENNTIFVSTDITNIDKFLSDDKALHLYRFIQECINNILKHSEAKAFSISIIKENSLILIEIKDNGKGFDVNKASIKNSLGLKTIEERVRFLNGELVIDSKLKIGTTTKAKIPF